MVADGQTAVIMQSWEHFPHAFTLPHPNTLDLQKANPAGERTVHLKTKKTLLTILRTSQNLFSCDSTWKRPTWPPRFSSWSLKAAKTKSCCMFYYLFLDWLIFLNWKMQSHALKPVPQRIECKCTFKTDPSRNKSKHFSPYSIPEPS